MTDEGPDPLRRQGHAPAPDHAHERQAARAGGQQAGALLRDRGDGRGRHRARSGSSSRPRPATRSARPPATARGSACAITYIEQDAPLGLAHAVLTAEPFLGDSPFVMYLGDNLLRDGIVDARRRRSAPSEPDALILLTPVPDPEHYGVAELDGDNAWRGWSRSRRSRRRDLALVGVYMFTPAIFDAGARDRAVAGAASSRSPTRSRRSSTAACASTRTSCTAGGRTPARCRTCSRPTG